MLYTICNALGTEPDAWRDGKLLTKFSLTISAEYEPWTGVFWPWRSSEDNVLGKVTNEQFRMLSADYNAEQKALRETIPEKEARLEQLKASAADVDAFIEMAKVFNRIDELTPEILRLFIQRIEVGERSKKGSRSAPQSIRIVYRKIGDMDSAAQELVEDQPETPRHDETASLTA